MAYCLNPRCIAPETPGEGDICQHCQASLLLQGRYRALSRIGGGGFGKTFKAQDEGKPSRPVCVIKQLFYNNADTRQKSIELFEQEAVYLEKLGDHSQIPSLYFQGQQDGIHYIVQEYVDGETLEQELKSSGPFSEEKIWQVLAELVPLLAELHQVEVIHRDIKPENIIRRRRDRRLVLVDFGAVKVATQTALAKTGTSIGDAQYAAPEQARGRAVFASDLYGLGTTCLHLITGQSPWDLYSDLEGRWIWRQLLPEGVTVSQRLGSILDRLVAIPLQQRFDRAEAVLKAMQPPAPPAPPRQPQRHPQRQPSPPQDRPYQEPKPPTPLRVNPTPGQPLTKTRKGNLALRGVLSRRAFVGLGVTAFGVVVARSFWQNGSIAPSAGSEPASALGLDRGDVPVALDSSVAGLQSDLHTFETVWGTRSAFLLGVTKGVRESRTITCWVEDLGNGVDLHLVQIPAGSFIMGQTEAERQELIRQFGTDNHRQSFAKADPQHRVNFLRNFWMGQYEVTQGQWRVVAGFPKVSRDLNPDPSRFKGDDLLPVERVSWDDAVEFCQRLSHRTGRNYRLPTEAEWEYACRAGTNTPFSFGETITPNLVNYIGFSTYGNAPKGEFREKTTVVGNFPANPWGLYDMHGNLWEWCLDQYTNNYTWKDANHPMRSDGSITLTYSNDDRIMRGGSWFTPARDCRSAVRRGKKRDNSAFPAWGFRILLSSGTP